VRTITVDEAVKELEEKAAMGHRNNPMSRSALWGQWCRRMEDTRLDAECKYIDPAQDNIAVSFDEVFIRSRALEEAVASVIRMPVSDDAELTFLFSHCLEGDAMFHRKLADGLRMIGECFKESQRSLPDGFVDHLLVVLTALKVNPKSKRDSGYALHKIDEEIKFHIAKSQELARGGAAAAPEARHKCTAELMRLGTEKQKMLACSKPEGETDEGQLRVVFEELVTVLGTMLSEFSQTHSQVQRQHEAFQNKIKMAMMGDDAEYMKVLEIDQQLDNEISRLQARKLELQRELEEVSMGLANAEQRKRAHHSSSSKIINVYQQRMKAFQGDDSKMTNAFKSSQSALDRCQKSHQFLSMLSETTISTISERSQRVSREREEANRQVLVFLRGHLESVRDASELVKRRFHFCRSKLDSMRSELEEAREIGLADLAADLASAVSKFEDMQREAVKGMEGSDRELERVQKVLDEMGEPDESDTESRGLRDDICNLLSSLRLSASNGATNGD